MAITTQGYANLASFPPTGAANIIYIDLSNGNTYKWNGTVYVAYPFVNGFIQLGQKDAAWFTANPGLLLLKGQRVDLGITGLYKSGDGVTALASLPFLGNVTVIQDGLQSGGTITIGTYGGSGTNNDIRVSPASWLISPNIYSTAIDTDFLDIALSSLGNQRYIGFYGDNTNTISKVEGIEAAIASYPTTPVGTIVIGYVLVGDANISTTPDLSGYEEKINKVSTIIGNETNADKYPNIPALISYLQANYNLTLQQVTDNGSSTTNIILVPKIKQGSAEVDLSDGTGVVLVGSYVDMPSFYGDYTTGEVYAGSGFTVKKIRAFDGNASIITGSRLLAVANDKIELRHDVLNEFNAPDNNVNGNFQSTAPNGNFMYNITSASGWEFADLAAGEVNTNNTRTRVAHDLLIELNAASVKKNNQEIATQTYVDGLVAGLLDDRGSYDASSNLFPSSGGSGTAGAILKGDIWYISVAGTLGGSTVTVGDSVRALVDTPGQTSTNWSILETNIGYVPENVANKTDTVTGNEANSTKYLSVKGYYDYLVGLVWMTAQLFGTWINGLTSKTTPVDADQIVLMDSADTNKSKKLSWANLKATLASTFFLDATSSIQTQLDNKKDTFSIWCFGGALSPADNITYYFNSTISPTTTATSHQMTFGFNCRITSAIVYFTLNTVAGSTENNTINFRNITQATSPTITTTAKSNGSTTNIVSETITGLSISVGANDNWCLEWVAPAYATNPTGVAVRVQLFIEKTA